MRRTKVIVFIVLIIMLSINGNNRSLAIEISNSQYSITIPNTYKKDSTKSFSKSNGDNISIDTYTYSDNAPGYNQNTLKQFKQELIESLQDSSFEVEILKSELATCSKHQYKAYYILASTVLYGSTIYVGQYYIVQKNITYIITFSTNNKSNLTSSETVNMLNTFTISNYVEPSENFLGFTFVTAIIAFFICNYIVKTFLEKYGESNEYVDISVKCRKKITFNAIALLIIRLIDVNFFTVLGIIYYSIIMILQFVVFIAWLLEMFRENDFDSDGIKILICNTLNMIINGFVGYSLYTILN